MPQQVFRFNRVQTVNINPPEPAQSKDEILKFRVEPRLAEKIKAFCFGRRITVSDYVRQHLQMDPSYFDYVDTLNAFQAELLPLIRMLAGKR